MTPQSREKTAKTVAFRPRWQAWKVVRSIAAVRQRPRTPRNWWCSFAYFESFLWHFNKKQRAEVIFRLPRPVSCKNQENGSGKRWSLHTPLKAGKDRASFNRSPVRNRTCWTTEAFEDGGIHNPEFYTAHSWAVDQPRSVETQAWLSPSAKSVWHFAFFPSDFLFSFFFSMFAAEMQHFPAMLQRKEINSMPGTHCLQNCLSLRGAGEPFFLAQIIVFSPSRVAFGGLMLRETKKNYNCGLTEHFQASCLLFFRVG